MIRNFFLINIVIFSIVNQSFAQKFEIESTDFKNNQFIPKKNSCNGLSPKIVVSNIPTGTKSLILLIEDPDAKNGNDRRKTFMHLIANLPSKIDVIQEGEISQIAKQIINNDRGQAKYLGPCPPKGPVHHYFFTLIALNKPFDLNEHTTDYFRNTWNYKNETNTSRFVTELKNNFLGVAQLMGKYKNID